MAASTPFCHCGCGKKCFPADIERGYAAAVDLPCGTVYFARKVACAQKFLAQRRPDLKEDLIIYYAKAGKLQGKGSGRWRRALRAASRSPPARAPVNLCSFLENQ